jgi:hypothetical protein
MRQLRQQFVQAGQDLLEEVIRVRFQLKRFQPDCPTPIDAAKRVHEALKVCGVDEIHIAIGKMPGLAG